MISVSLTFMHPSMRDNLVNWYGARAFKFQWQNKLNSYKAVKENFYNVKTMPENWYY